MELKEKIIKEIKKIYDPEIPVNIYELGLIYDVLVKERSVKVTMTLTCEDSEGRLTVHNVEGHIGGQENA